MTTLYLEPGEWEVLAGGLAGVGLRKWRYRYPVDADTYVVDEFQDSLAGLITAELEFDDVAALLAHRPPSFAEREITHDPAYGGGALLGLP